MHLFSTLPSQCLIPYIHPKFYSLHNMPEHCGTIASNGIEMPLAMNLSSERLERGGLFMLDDSQNIFLWVGRDAVPQLCMDLFGVPNYESIRGGKVKRHFPLVFLCLRKMERDETRITELTFFFLSPYLDNSPNIGERL